MTIIRQLLLILGLSLMLNPKLEAQQFDTYFVDSTLRIDFDFSGNSKHINIYPEELHQTAGWYGRRQHLDSLALQGYGRITMRDSITGKVIYRHSFSSLFQEWLSTDEAKTQQKSFENVFLMPYPRQSTLIEIELDNVERQAIAKHSFYFNPKDILVHRHPAGKSNYTYHYLHRGANKSNAIDIAILAEGYTEQELPTFVRDARRAAEELLRYAPFKDYKDNINIIAVESSSQDSGISLPRNHDWKRSAFSSHFDTFYSDRYLTTRRLKAVHDALINIPYEHIIILANTDTYGGGGIYNSYTISSIHPQYYLPVVVHEFGHSFGGLADEYYYDDDTMTDSYSTSIEPWEQNITSLRDFNGKKWSNIIKKGTPIPTPKSQEKKYGVGVYEGAAYTAKGLYKATEDCRMRTNSCPTFCPACHQALDQLIRYYLGK